MLAQNVVHFARVLRRAGIPIGPAKVIDALHSLQAVGVQRRDDFYYALSTVLVDRRDQQFVFDQAFELFWRDPSRARELDGLAELLSGVRAPGSGKPALAPRVARAMLLRPPHAPQADELPPELRLDASMTMSAREILQTRDFAAMTPEEQADTKRMMATLHIPLPQIPSRRAQPVAHGARIDLRATMRRMTRTADGFVELRHRRQRQRPATLVILCDISGSMESYTRMFLHFIHAVSNSDSRVHTFLFGTRLSHISRLLQNRDVDIALGHVARQVADWAGGTRISACLAEFNQYWARRLLGQGAVVLLITDGLDSEGAEGLGAEMERLSLACRQLVWLNPLLRFEGFEARPAGIRAMLPYVDLFLPAHNLASLTHLGEVLSVAGARRPLGRRIHHPLGERYGNV
ncbi:vWA domain-containing protein [Noviherbaspirillum denitrificans]|nr:VWA domain-containing protein [Noviherbaspirillum denitrificans]